MPFVLKPLKITKEVIYRLKGRSDNLTDLAIYQEIDEDAAELLGNSTIPLELNKFKEISVATLNHLSKRKDEIFLDGLKSLTIHQAEALSSHSGGVSLNGLIDISPEVLEYLVLNPRNFLRLNGLKSLDVSNAAVVSKFKGDLYLAGITSLNEEEINHLAEHEGYLFLSGLKSLTVQQARQLVNHRGDIYLKPDFTISREGAYILHKFLGKQVCGYSIQNFIEDSLNDSTSEAYENILKIFKSNYSDKLTLNELHDLNCQSAGVLAQFCGQLIMPSIEDLNPNTAALLACHKGSSLSLDGIKNLSIPLAQSLAQHRGDLSLLGLEVFETGSLEILAHHDGSLRLPLPDGGNDKYGWFNIEDQKAIWKPSGYDHHDLAVVQEIINSHFLELEIPKEVHFISNAVLVRLGYVCGTLTKDISLPGIMDLNVDQTRLLTGNYLTKNEKDSISKLSLDGLIRLEMQVAEELGKSDLHLSLSGLLDISPNNLLAISRNLNGIENHKNSGIDNETRKVSPIFSRDLYLNGLQSMPILHAEILSHHVGILELNGLEKLTHLEAKELLAHNGYVTLKGLKISEINNTILRGFLDQVFILTDQQIYSLIGTWSSHNGIRKYMLNADLGDPDAVKQMMTLLVNEIAFFIQINKSMYKFSSENKHKFNIWQSYDRAASIIKFVRDQRNTTYNNVSDDLFIHVAERYFESIV